MALISGYKEAQRRKTVTNNANLLRFFILVNRTKPDFASPFHDISGTENSERPWAIERDLVLPPTSMNNLHITICTQLP